MIAVTVDVTQKIVSHTNSGRSHDATLLIIGLSSSLSIGSEVLCTQPNVQRWRSRTNVDLQYGYVQHTGITQNIHIFNVYMTWHFVNHVTFTLHNSLYSILLCLYAEWPAKKVSTRTTTKQGVSRKKSLQLEKNSHRQQPPSSQHGTAHPPEQTN